MATISKSLRLLVCVVSFVHGMLLSAGSLHAQPSPDELIKICISGTVDELAVAIASGVDINAFGKHGITPLMAVAWDRTNSTAKKCVMLLKSGADPMKKDNHDKTVFHYATAEGNAELMKLLIDAGVDVNTTNAFGVTPLLDACLKKPNWEIGRQKAAVQLLLMSGATLKPTAVSSTTPLIIASGSGDPEVIELLLEAGSNVNEIDERKMTPLMAAARSNPNPEVVALLIKKGANLNLRDLNGETALDKAIKYKNTLAIESIKGLLSSVPQN